MVWLCNVYLNPGTPPGKAFWANVKQTLLETCVQVAKKVPDIKDYCDKEYIDSIADTVDDMLGTNVIPSVCNALDSSCPNNKPESC